ncbi:hypothetical protein [Paenibacillus koleovorans]|uniref:hypothetical protein n=1 Tax=Paenibacillus koleovorans TaxID=121608 RepID=UPI000FDB7C06|nr:hypothetical protein [Paenibacillus koleovorans]
MQITIHRPVRIRMGLQDKSLVSLDLQGDVILIKKQASGFPVTIEGQAEVRTPVSIKGQVVVPSFIVNAMQPRDGEVYRIIAYSQNEAVAALCDPRNDLPTRPGAVAYMQSNKAEDSGKPENLFLAHPLREFQPNDFMSGKFSSTDLAVIFEKLAKSLRARKQQDYILGLSITKVSSQQPAPVANSYKAQLQDPQGNKTEITFQLFGTTIKAQEYLQGEYPGWTVHYLFPFQE